MIEFLYQSLAAMEGAVRPFTREDHREKELKLQRNGKHTPRRSQTQHEYYIPTPPVFTLYTITPSPSPRDDDSKQLSTTASGSSSRQKVEERSRPAPPRPALGPPRRSYSVTDHEPIPYHHRPSSRLQLMDLPPEIHYAIFDFLDPIDSTCFGLASRNLYAIHRRLNGTVPLSARREGPNELEWAWHLAGNIRTNPPPSPTTAAETDKDEQVIVRTKPGVISSERLSSLRVRGQAYCRKCGVTRCQLHKHIQQWIGDEYEYCSVKKRFGPIAPEGAKSYCFMSKPGDETRCGRHFVRRNKVVLK
ncbi:hypothetical protein QBC38DRAFT_109794 [Podospora fimiseda]|uniref:F-box domain-containing protein n=1 Tax=Podospora fimiseda TaxID=252190 RepID=A0AAN7GXX6_9PEZI|nr:hypothetical protein QBC38DRAFT_109794 [Podospora fimiseda]